MTAAAAVRPADLLALSAAIRATRPADLRLVEALAALDALDGADLDLVAEALAPPCPCRGRRP